MFRARGVECHVQGEIHATRVYLRKTQALLECCSTIELTPRLLYHWARFALKKLIFFRRFMRAVLTNCLLFDACRMLHVWKRAFFIVKFFFFFSVVDSPKRIQGSAKDFVSLWSLWQFIFSLSKRTNMLAGVLLHGSADSVAGHHACLTRMR